MLRLNHSELLHILQQLTSSVSASYDSLEGASGNQSAPLGLNGELAGARQYVSDSAEATIEIIPVLVAPKQIVRVSNSGLVAPANPQPVSIGEEIEFQLRTLIPVAQLRSFVVRDELPEGLSCTEAPAVDLNAPPYDAAGFIPGGVFTPTCTETEVIWDFGNQIVTQSPRVDRRFDFGIQFIARVDNIDANREDVVIRNGGSATVTTVSYVDEGGNDVVLSIPEAAVVVREPVMELTKAFSVVEVDADDVPRVTVTATNTGTTTAYNLRVLDDLSAAGLSFRDDVTGSDPPAADIAMFGADSPVFSWPLGFGIAPGETISFSFQGTVARLYDLLGPDGANAIITLDDDEPRVRARFDHYCSYHRIASLGIGSGLDDTVHTVTVEIHPEQPDRSSVLNRVKDTPGFDPAKYDGTAMRVGSLMLIGDIVRE